jgi:hypothetical protein
VQRWNGLKLKQVLRLWRLISCDGRGALTVAITDVGNQSLV